MNNLVNHIRDSHSLKRWNGVNIIGHRRSISEHSFEVAMISLNLIKRLDIEDQFFLDQVKGQVYEYSLFHDLAEVYTNDVSYIAKSQSPRLKQALTDCELKFLTDNDYIVEADVPLHVRLIVKTADIISVAYEIQEQLEFNNTRKFDLNNVENIIKSVLPKYLSLLNNPLTNKIFLVCEEVLTKEKPWLVNN